MATKEDLENMQEPSVLLTDGRIISHSSPEFEDYDIFAKTLKIGIVARHLIPESVADSELWAYLELAYDFVTADIDSIQDEQLLYEVAFEYVKNFEHYVIDSRSFGDAFHGIWDSLDAFASELFEVTVEPELSDLGRTYFDYDEWVKDLGYAYVDIELPNGYVAVFRS